MPFFSFKLEPGAETSNTSISETLETETGKRSQYYF